MGNDQQNEGQFEQARGNIKENLGDAIGNEQMENEWKEESNRLADIEVNAYLETKVQPVEAMFDYLYAELPADIAAQRADAMKWEKH